MRGEYLTLGIDGSAKAELPPRARRILGGMAYTIDKFGTTSACAENTFRREKIAHTTKNYLRVRGEYEWLTPHLPPQGELPPRARRIPLPQFPLHLTHGTTSACAENTFARCYQRCPSGNYLRVRGEYVREKPVLPKNWELPPRARRIPIYRRRNTPSGGTTSACAENTLNELGLL